MSKQTPFAKPALPVGAVYNPNASAAGTDTENPENSGFAEFGTVHA
ncbi:MULTISPECIES: hypothetical protein [unclassified Novosphingobium]|nr:MULTISPECIES: hypothetical protein [unclassified Novosphingobium]HQS70790.1 hypothetical protein [Novosphingobium sp.]